MSENEEYSLVKWNAARRAIIEAKTIDEVKSIKDQSEAMRAYAKQIGESLEVQNNIAEIKLRAERRIGQMLKEMPKNEGSKGTGSNQYEVRLHDATTPKLSDLGIEKHESSRWQKIADLPEDIFESIVSDTKAEQKELTEALMVKTSKIIDREIKIKEQEENIKTGKLKLPEGKFEVIVIDPPWNYGREYDPDSSRVANPYPEMTQEQLLNLEFASADNSFLFLWTTHAFIFDAKELMKKWGFEYKSIIVWDKEKMGIGFWFRMQCEFCLFGVKGNPLWKGKDVRDIIREAKTSHSTKPEQLYDLINKNCIGRKLDYFARKKREGWEVYGDEI
jgi:N6-adenosine-specific RNA methylase IME4